MTMESTRDFSITGQESANFIRATGTIYSVGSFQVHLVDLFSLVFSVCAIAGISRWRANQAATLGFLLLAALITVGLLTSIIGEGLQAGTAEWRDWLVSISAFGYASTRPRLWQTKDLRAFGWVGLFALCLLLFEVSKYGLSAGAGQTYQVGAEAINGRTIGPTAAFVMLIGGWLLALLPSQGRIGNFQRIISGFCFAGVVIAQQRTMWIALILSVLAWLVIQFIDQSRRTALGVIIRLIPELLLASVAASLVIRALPALQNSASNASNLDWRQRRWDLSLSAPRSIIEWLTGSSLGPSEAEILIKQIGIQSAHSFYIASIETVGLLGLFAALTVVIGSFVVRLGTTYSHLSLTLLAAILASGYSYDLQWVAYLYVAAFGVMNTTERQKQWVVATSVARIT